MAKGVKTGGRVKGVPNRATASVKEMAGKHGPEAIAVLADILHNGETEPGRIAAAKELLDRAYGKSTTVVGNPEGEAFRMVTEIVLRGVRSNAND